MSIHKVSFLGLISILLAGFALGGEAIPNWPAPATWSPARSHGLTAQDVTNPLPFIGLAPCRIVDTRGNGAPITGGMFTGGADVRTYGLAGICGIPSLAAAVSLNFTVTGPGQTTAGFLLAWPTGGAIPLVSILNWDHVPAQVANAAVVPTGSPTSITVNVSAPTHVIMDINGYYSAYSNGGGLGVTYPIGSIVSIGAGGAAISGSNDTSGRGYGVVGFVASGVFDGAGVWGVERTNVAALDSYNPSAVRGDSRGGGNGVLGISTFQGVAGSLINGAGHEIAYGILGYSFGTATYGVFSGGNTGASGMKSFVEPHPSDASKVIRYVSLEGPEAGTYFRGRGKFQNGLATIDVPEDFRMVTDSEGLSIQVTPIGELATVAILRIDLEGILVKASRNVEFFFTVNGVRKTHKDFQPIGPGSEFMPRSADARIPAYLTEGQKALLVSNGTYNADGSVNMETAERLGWVKMWADREEQTRAVAEPAAKDARQRANLAGQQQQP